MNKKGFTLVELLAVLVILAAIITIAVPNVISMSKKIKADMFCDKVDLLITDAKLYGQDNYDAVESATKAGTTYSVSVTTLVNYGYAKKDNDKCSVGDAENPCIKDPRDDSSLDNASLELAITNKRVVATYKFASDEDKAACADWFEITFILC